MKNKLSPFLLLLLCSFCSHTLQAQSLDRQVIGAAGAYQTASWGSLSSTSGEPVINTLTTSSFVLTQGFQQPSQSDLSVYGVPSGNLTVKAFPVPAADLINVVINTGNGGKHYSVTLFDVPGRQLKLPCLELSSSMEMRFTFDLRSIANGTYLMLISDEHNIQVKAIKFTKIN